MDLYSISKTYSPEQEQGARLWSEIQEDVATLLTALEASAILYEKQAAELIAANARAAGLEQQGYGLATSAAYLASTLLDGSRFISRSDAGDVLMWVQSFREAAATLAPGAGNVEVMRHREVYQQQAAAVHFHTDRADAAVSRERAARDTAQKILSDFHWAAHHRGAVELCPNDVCARYWAALGED